MATAKRARAVSPGRQGTRLAASGDPESRPCLGPRPAAQHFGGFPVPERWDTGTVACLGSDTPDRSPQEQRGELLPPPSACAEFDATNVQSPARRRIPATLLAAGGKVVRLGQPSTAEAHEAMRQGIEQVELRNRCDQGLGTP